MKLIFREILQEYEILLANHGVTMTNKLLNTWEVLTKVFFPTNMLSNQKRDTTCMIRKIRTTKMLHYPARLQELNNYPPIFIGYDEIKNMTR